MSRPGGRSGFGDQTVTGTGEGNRVSGTDVGKVFGHSSDLWSVFEGKNLKNTTRVYAPLES